MRYTRGKLPHWEVEDGRYFVTVRCAGSLPADVMTRLAEVHLSLAGIESRSPDFAELQRRYFRTMDKYLDAGVGSCPLRTDAAAQSVVDELVSLAECGVEVPHFTVMPNHWHALIRPAVSDWPGLNAIMKRVKGRTGRAIRKAVGGAGPVWQREWFDRWMRDDAEWNRCVSYIRQNSVRAGIVAQWQDHHWTR